MGKLVGLKSTPVMAIANAIPGLSQSVVEASTFKRSLNPEFRLLGTGNPASPIDSFGILARPKGGNSPHLQRSRTGQGSTAPFFRIALILPISKDYLLVLCSEGKAHVPSSEGVWNEYFDEQGYYLTGRRP